MTLLAVTPNEEKKIAERTHRYTRDHIWVRDNYQELVKVYDKKYIAVFNKKVCFNSDDAHEMVSVIKNSGKNVEDYVIKYVTSEKSPP